ncbi:MAG: BMC domain-containing protein [Deltaproteobacteria bacterium]|nr:BMC domain-containing protein [Deltaproteobacteria bacterium]
MLAVGYVETRSVARGVEVADVMAKTSDVRIETAMPTCPGKFLVMATGLVAAVRTAVEVGVAVAGETMTDFTVIPSVHPDVIPALGGMVDVETIEALGVIETFTMASAVRAADEAVKTADVRLIEVRLGRGLAGKAFVMLTGHVAAVRAAVEAGVKALADEALILGTTVIPSPHPQILDKIL